MSDDSLEPQQSVDPEPTPVRMGGSRMRCDLCGEQFPYTTKWQFEQVMINNMMLMVCPDRSECDGRVAAKRPT